MRTSFLNRLQWRIWLAVMGAVVLTMLAVTLLVNSMGSEPRARVLQIRDGEGRLIAQTQVEPKRRGMSVPMQMADGQEVTLHFLPPGQAPEAMPHESQDTVSERNANKREHKKALRFREHQNKPPLPPGLWPPRGAWGLFMLLSILAVAIGVGAYPVARRMTQRLQTLQSSVDEWGQGKLNARVHISGDDEVAQLGRRFNEAAERIEALLQSHKTLLANTSHELRTPLARLRMGLELLGTKPITLKNRVEIERNIRELDDLIEEILLASRLDAQNPHAAPHAMPLHAVDVLGLAAQECARYGVPLYADVQEAVVQGQERLLQRLLRNLLQNAQRYGTPSASQAPQENAAHKLAEFGTSAPMDLDAQRPAHSALHSEGELTPLDEQTIAVHVHPCAEGRGVCIDVLDRGAGVPEPLREKIFEPFFRLPHAAEREGGVGLGLALVRSIAQHHHSTVHCLPRDGGGSCFRVSLPQA